MGGRDEAGREARSMAGRERNAGGRVGRRWVKRKKGKKGEREIEGEGWRERERGQDRGFSRSGSGTTERR
eukprot:3941284-Rhodomonas_salina.4